MDENMTESKKPEKITEEEMKKLKPEEIGATTEAKESEVEGQGRHVECPWCNRYVHVHFDQHYARCYHCGGGFRIHGHHHGGY
jgi:hypothetical protein